MQEDFLHYVWKHKAFSTSSLKTTDDEPIIIKHFGIHNHNSGPDFFNAQISINGQLWAGNVEIHIKSSYWYLHNHEKDKAYDNVILHVVWDHDSEIFRKDNSKIPTLELRAYVDNRLLDGYNKLLQSKSWINCENDFAQVNDFVLDNWLERLFIERLERKSEEVSSLLVQSNNDWEGVLFKMLLKNFGLKINGDAFKSLANSIDYSMVRKLQKSVGDLEALLYGQADMLNNDIQDSYHSELIERYGFIKQKFKVSNIGVIPIQFFRLRPPNFPTIRLSQFANLYAKEHQLFSKIVCIDTLEEFYELFKIGVTDFWMTHYTFNKSSKKSKKLLTNAFIDLLIINTIIPLKFSYAKSLGKTVDDELLQLIKQIKSEKNSIVDKYLQLKPMENNALNSQGLIQLKAHYCNKNKCLHCAVGNSLIIKN